MRVYAAAIEMNQKLALVSARIEKNDRELLRQLKRAASSVVLNVAEGLGTEADRREHRFQAALGSVREVVGCLDVATAWGYLGEEEALVRRSADRVNRMLREMVRVVR